MRKNLFLSALFLLITTFSINLSAQTNADAGIKANFAGGEVTSIVDGKIVLQTKDGAIDIILSDKTEYKSIPPGNLSLKAAIASNLSEIGVGDKLLVTGMVAADKKTIPAKTVYQLTKAVIAQRDSKDQEEWKTRSIVGRVASYNPQTNIINVSVSGMMGEKTVAVTPKENAEFYRYAPDSNKFSEKKKSVMTEIEVGDSIRVLGDKNAEGTEVKAEKVLSGSFKTVGGTITAINAEKNEITINNFETKKEVTIVIGDSSVLKQFPAEMAARMSQFQGGGQGGFRPPTQGGNQQPNPQQNPPTQGQNPNGMGQGGGMRGGGGGIGEMLERFPTVKLTDLKVGEMIAVSSTKNADPSRIKAIQLVSGVEPFIKMQQMRSAGQGAGRGSSSPNFTIPGLDGFGGQ